MRIADPTTESGRIIDGSARPGRWPTSQVRRAIALLALASCGGGGGDHTSIVGPTPVNDPPKVLTRVQVSLPATSIIVGDRMVATANGIDQNGAPMPIAALTWATSSPAVATASDSGLVLAVAPGTTTLVASAGAVQGSANLTVILVPVTRVTITPEVVPLGLGGMQQLAADARDDRGNVLPGRPIAWASSAPQIATVSSNGLVTAIALGTANVTATTGGVTATALVTVTTVFQPVARVTMTPTEATVAMGQTLQLGAVLTDAAGNVLAGHGVAWVSSAPTVAIVSATGFVMPVAAGTTQVTATSEGERATAVLTVTDDLIVEIAAPDVTTTASDSVYVVAIVKNRNLLVSVVAVVGLATVALQVAHIGARGLPAWAAQVNIVNSYWGATKVVVIATDALGAVGSASVVFRHDPRNVGGTSTGGRKSKSMAPVVKKRVP